MCIFLIFSYHPSVANDRSSSALSTVLVQVPIQPRAGGERRNDEADACHRAPPESTALPEAAAPRVVGRRRGRRRRRRAPRVTVAALALALTLAPRVTVAASLAVAAAALARARAAPVAALAALAVAALVAEPLLGARAPAELVGLARGLDV